MMEFDPLLSPLMTWIFGIFLLGFLLFLIGKIERADLSIQRKRVKQVLNSLFFAVLILSMLNPVWRSERNTTPMLVVSEDLTKEELAFWKDSLGLRKSVTRKNFKSNSDSIILLGADFPREFLYSLRAKSINWIIPESESAVIFLDFKAILRKGEKQLIRMNLTGPRPKQVSIKQAGSELVAMDVASEADLVTMEATAAVVGRNEWEIRSDSVSLGRIHFFVLPSEPLAFKLQAGFPNPEMRALSKFLLSRGNQVQEHIQLSSNTALSSSELPADSVDVFILDPSQVENVEIQQQIARGASALVVNLRDATTEVRAINQAFGTNLTPFPTERRDASVLENGLELLPFEWKSEAAQQVLAENAFAIQPVGNAKVGVSLLSSSFQLAQSGDTVAYARVWDEILGELRPRPEANWSVGAPLFKNQFFKFEFNGLDSLVAGLDPASYRPSLVNPDSKVKFRSLQSAGWQKLDYGLEVYVSDSLDWPEVYAQRERVGFLKSEVWLSSETQNHESKESIPWWFWGLAFLILLTALWAEPKILR